MWKNLLSLTKSHFFFLFGVRKFYMEQLLLHLHKTKDWNPTNILQDPHDSRKLLFANNIREQYEKYLNLILESQTNCNIFFDRLEQFNCMSVCVHKPLTNIASNIPRTGLRGLWRKNIWEREGLLNIPRIFLRIIINTLNPRITRILFFFFGDVDSTQEFSG